MVQGFEAKLEHPVRFIFEFRDDEVDCVSIKAFGDQERVDVDGEAKLLVVVTVIAMEAFADVIIA